MSSKTSKKVSSAGNWQERLDKAWWLVGFVDGEGTFSANIFRNKTSKLGWQCFPEFVVTQGEKSFSALEAIQELLGCGEIYINRRKDNHKENLVRYCVRSREDLRNTIVPFFEQYPLRTEKKKDFMKFSNILTMMDQNKHLNANGLKEIAQIVQTMNRKQKSAYLESSEAIRQDP